MKSQKVLKIIEIALLILTVLFVVLKNTWVGFSYLGFGCLCVAMLGAIIFCIFAYINTKKELKNEFDEYLRQKLLQGDMPKELDEKQTKIIFKQYMQENRWEYTRYVAYMAVCVALLATSIWSIIHNLTNL